MKIKRVPSFMSSRPGFPAGLRVLLLDKWGSKEACAQLRQCSYMVTCCDSVELALETMRGSSAPFDILLADAALLTSNCTGSTQLREAMKELPTLVMSENPKPDEVMTSISMGVAEVLEKPLCPLKLKNIWQHTIRRVMSGKLQGRLADPLRGMSSHSATHPQLDLSPSASRDLNNTATSCDDALLMLQCSSPTSQQAAGHAKEDFMHVCEVSAATDSEVRKGLKRKSREFSGSSPAASKQLVPPAASPGLPGQVDGSVGTAANPSDLSVPSSGVAMGLTSWPCPMAGCGLAPGMVWGTPMNPNHIAPGITPPIFNPPLAPPLMPAMLPGASWPGLAMPPACSMPGSPQMPGMCTLPMPGMSPMGMLGANPFIPGLMAPAVPSQLPPLPLHMLISACNPAAGIPDVLSPCSPGPTSATSMSNKSCQDAVRVMPVAPAVKTKMQRCESHQLLPSLEDLMADNGPEAEMDMELEALSFAFRRNNSLDDLISQAVPAF